MSGRFKSLTAQSVLTPREPFLAILLLLPMIVGKKTRKKRLELENWTGTTNYQQPPKSSISQNYDIECNGINLHLTAVCWEFKVSTRSRVSQIIGVDWKPLNYLSETAVMQSPFGCQWQDIVTIRYVATNYLGL